MKAQFDETIAGRIVLSVGCFPRKADGSWDSMIVTDDQKAKLDELHLRKIDLADQVLVININGYIGESTSREIEYARRTGKLVRYLECSECSRDGICEPAMDALAELHGVDEL